MREARHSGRSVDGELGFDDGIRERRVRGERGLRGGIVNRRKTDLRLWSYRV